MKILGEDWIFNIADFGRRLEAGFERDPSKQPGSGNPSLSAAMWDMTPVLSRRPPGRLSLRGGGQVGRRCEKILGTRL